MRRGLGLFCVVVGALGIALQFGILDSVDLLAPLFYALPLPIVAGAWLLGGPLLGRDLGKGVFLAGLILGGLWIVRDYGVATPATGDWKFATWNLQGPRHPFPPLMDFVRRERPDFVAMIESETLDDRAIRHYEAALPGYRAVPLGGHRACLVRGNVSVLGSEKLSEKSHVASLRVSTGRNGGWLRVLVVDLDANPFHSRASALAWVAREAARESRTVVLGDFNTPLESVHLAPLRSRFRSATETRHRGFRETWPYNLPLLSLDQVWLSRDLEPVFSRRQLTLASDHTPLLVHFSARR